MSCLEIKPIVVPKVVRGEDKTLTVKLNDTSTGFPFDISAATEIVAILLNQIANTYTEKKLSTSGVSILNGPGGALQIFITKIESALLALSTIETDPVNGTYSDIELRLTIGGKLTIVNLFGCLWVIDPRFPAAP